METVSFYAGRTRSGFTPAARAKLYQLFRGLESAKCPFVNLPESQRSMGLWTHGRDNEGMPLAPARSSSGICPSHQEAKAETMFSAARAAHRGVTPEHRGVASLHSIRLKISRNLFRSSRWVEIPKAVKE